MKKKVPKQTLGKKRKSAFHEETINSLSEGDFAKISTVSEFRGLPASFVAKNDAIAPKTASQIDFEVEKKRKMVKIETADDVIVTSHLLTRKLVKSAT